MSEHTAKDQNRADRLYDDHSIPKVSEITGIPEGTLYYWKKKGWISTDTTHYGQHRKHPDEVIERADRLIDVMPPSSVSDVIDVPVSTIKDWRQKGWISTDKCWKGHYQRGNYKADVQAVVNRVRHSDLKQKDIAEEFGISEATVSRYLSLYRNHEL